MRNEKWLNKRRSRRAKRIRNPKDRSELAKSLGIERVDMAPIHIEEEPLTDIEVRLQQLEQEHDSLVRTHNENVRRHNKAKKDADVIFAAGLLYWLSR